MTSTAAAVFYDLALRSLEEQEPQVAGLRSRTGTMVAAAAVTATLLAREVFAGSDPDGVVGWAATAVGLVGLAIVLGASVQLLRSHELVFSIDAAEVFEDALAHEALDDLEGLQTGLTYELSSIQADNTRTITDMKTAFALALGGLVLEVLGLGLGAAVA
jgi:hypothetical protein